VRVFILGFCTQQKQVDALANKAGKALQGDGILWFAYPKGTSRKNKCAFNRDNGWMHWANMDLSR